MSALATLFILPFLLSTCYSSSQIEDVCHRNCLQICKIRDNTDECNRRRAELCKGICMTLAFFEETPASSSVTTNVCAENCDTENVLCEQVAKNVRQILLCGREKNKCVNACRRWKLRRREIRDRFVSLNEDRFPDRIMINKDSR